MYHTSKTISSQFNVNNANINQSNSISSNKC